METTCQEGTIQDVTVLLEQILDVLAQQQDHKRAEEEEFDDAERNVPLFLTLNAKSLIQSLESGEKTNQQSLIMKCVSILFQIPAVDNIAEHRRLVRAFWKNSSAEKKRITDLCCHVNVGLLQLPKCT